MIVFSENDFSLINNKDSSEAFETLFRINSIEISEVQTPTLGANSVIVREDMSITSSGSPYGGGTIYLQPTYVAINYVKDKGGFDIVMSASWKPGEVWLKVLPTSHYSTPIARMLQQVPTSILLMPSGVLQTFEKAPVFGIDADYLGVNNGQLIGAFGVKERTYASLFYPTTGSEVDLKALVDFITCQGDGCCYTKAGSVPGLVATDKVKAETKRIRELMKRYETLTVDYAKATAFAAPISLSLRQTAVVNSALCKPNAIRYLQQQEESGQNGDDKVEGIVLNIRQLADAISTIGFEEGVVNYLKSDKCNSTVLALIDGDFQEILNHYHLIYNKVKAETAYAQFKQYNGELANFVANCNKEIPNRLASLVKEIIATQDPEFASKVEGAYPAACTIPFYQCDPPIGDGSDANLILSKATRIVEDYGHDSDIPLEGDFDMTTIEGVKTFDNDREGLVKSLGFVRAIASPAAQIVQMFKAIKLHDKYYFTGGDTLEKRCRFFEINLAWGNGHGHPDDKKPSYHYAFKGGGENDVIATLQRARMTGAGIECDFKVTFKDCKYDQTMYDRLYDAINDRVGKIQGRMNELAGGKLVFTAKTIHLGPDKWSCCGAYKDNQWSENTEFCATFKAYLYFDSISQTFPMSDAAAAIEMVKGTSLALDNVDLTLGSKKAARIAGQICAVAASAAYKECEYLFKSLKDNYTYEPIGMFGNSYAGVVVSLKNLGRVARIDETYISNIVTLISSVEDQNTREALQPFSDAIKNAQAEWKTLGLIYYTDYNSIMEANPLTNKEAIKHYVLGGLDI